MQKRRWSGTDLHSRNIDYHAIKHQLFPLHIGSTRCLHHRRSPFGHADPTTPYMHHRDLYDLSRESIAPSILFSVFTSFCLINCFLTLFCMWKEDWFYYLFFGWGVLLMFGKWGWKRIMRREGWDLDDFCLLFLFLLFLF